MGKTLAEVIEDVQDMKQKQVDEQDKKGFADLWKRASDLIIKQMEGEGFHATDVEYLDGYYIFGHGTNSILHFHVRECPGWKFGIWWSEPRAPEQMPVQCDFFAQYEATIDKFKPSASVIEQACYLYEAGGLDYDIYANLKFIRDEPYLAFCRDYCGWDYNHEFHTREEAKEVYDKWVMTTELTKTANEKFTQLNKQLILEFLRDWLDEDEELFLVDRGPHWSPRYEYIIYSPTSKEEWCYIDDFAGWDKKSEPIQALVDHYKELQIYIDHYAFSPHVYVTPERPEDYVGDESSCQKIA